jgi:hypothetical protein
MQIIEHHKAVELSCGHAGSAEEERGESWAAVVLVGGGIAHRALRAPPRHFLSPTSITKQRQAFAASGVNKSTADYCAQVALPRSFFDDARGWAAVEAVAQPGSLPGGLDACSSRHVCS